MNASSELQPLLVRLILATFPKSWRVDGRAAEALSIAWDAADDEGRELLGARESIDLSWLGLRARATAASLTLPHRTRRLVGALALSGGLGLASFLLVIAAWPPPGSVAHPLASSGTVLYVAWTGSGLLVVSGREVAARWSMAGSAGLTAALALVDHVVGLRGPALFLLATMLVLNLLALGVGPLTRSPAPRRRSAVGASMAIAVALAVYCRFEIDWFPDNTYVGNVNVLVGLAEVVLVALGVAALVSLGSRTLRCEQLPALLISAGPWVILVARGSANEASRAHAHIVIAFLVWLLVASAALLATLAHRRRNPIHP